MRRYLFAASAVFALALVAAVPAQSQASWLSEALHARFDPGYYGGYYTPPVANYYSPYDYGYYSAPAYVTPPAVYYSTPYYAPRASYYWRSGPRYYGHDHGYRGGWRGERGRHHR